MCQLEGRFRGYLDLTYDIEPSDKLALEIQLWERGPIGLSTRFSKFASYANHI